MSWFWKSLKCYQNPGSCSAENGTKEKEKKLKDFEERSKLAAGDGGGPSLSLNELLKKNKALQKDMDLFDQMMNDPSGNVANALYWSSSIHTMAFQMAIKELKKSKFCKTSIIGKCDYIEPEKVEYILKEMPNDWRTSRLVGHYKNNNLFYNCWLANLVTNPQIFRSVVFDGIMDFKYVDTDCWKLTMKKATINRIENYWVDFWIRLIGSWIRIISFDLY